MFLKGAGGAVLAMPFLESLLPRTASGQAMTPPKRFIALKTFSTQLIQEWYPRFTGNGYQLHDSKYSGDKADGTTLLTQKLVSGKNYTWAPLADFQTTTGISGILGPAVASTVSSGITTGSAVGVELDVDQQLSAALRHGHTQGGERVAGRGSELPRWRDHQGPVLRCASSGR